MAVTIKMSSDAASDPNSLDHVFSKFLGSHVTVSTPHRTAEGEIKSVGWSDEHEAYGLWLGEIASPSRGEFVPFDYEQMEVTYS